MIHKWGCLEFHLLFFQVTFKCKLQNETFPVADFHILAMHDALELKGPSSLPSQLPTTFQRPMLSSFSNSVLLLLLLLSSSTTMFRPLCDYTNGMSMSWRQNWLGEHMSS